MINSILKTIRLSIYSLLLHKMRSALAVLGILIGITAVIWLVAMGQGVSEQAQKQIEQLGATNVIVRSIKPVAGGSQRGPISFMVYGLLRADYDRIIKNMPSEILEQAVPIREVPMEVRNGARTLEGRVVGCTPEYQELNQLTMEAGRFVSDNDNEHPPGNICVIAHEVARKLFPVQNPIGRSIQINNSEFYRVVGMTESRAPTAAIGGSLSAQEYNKDIYIPIQTFFARIGDTIMTSRSGSSEGEVLELSQITLSVKSPDEEVMSTEAVVYETADIVKTLLDKYHDPTNPDYGITVPQELLKQARLLEMMFNLLLVLIAGISLVVGGIGIMNIMLATVTERTREIGIRRALGANRGDIIRQFLWESVVLTSVGGFLGVGLGLMVGPTLASIRALAEKFRPDLIAALPPTIQNLEPIVAPWSIYLSFAISLGVGVLFGLYPAIRAAYMDPIEALRHE